MDVFNRPAPDLQGRLEEFMQRIDTRLDMQDRTLAAILKIVQGFQVISHQRKEDV